MSNKFYSKFLSILTIFILILALNITGVFGILNSGDNIENNIFGYGYGYSNNGLGNNENTENNIEEKIDDNKKKIKNIKDIIFENKTFQKLVLKLNNRFFEELEKAEILEKILKKNNLISELKEKYFIFLLELKKYEKNETTKENVTKTLEIFLNEFLKYKTELKKIGYFIKIENTTVYIPYFKNEILNKIINILNYKLKEILKNKNTEKKITISKLYSRYLLSFKLKIEIEKSIGNIFTTKYLNKLFLEL